MMKNSREFPIGARVRYGRWVGTVYDYRPGPNLVGVLWDKGGTVDYIDARRLRII